MGCNGILNHYEPLHEIRNPEAPPSKQPTKRRRMAKKQSEPDEEQQSTRATVGATFCQQISTGKAKQPTQDRDTERQKSDSLACDSERIPFIQKKEIRPATAARAHWGLYYFLFQMQQRQRGDWDLSSLSSMALHPTISREAAVSLWELSWQDSLEEDVIPMASTDYDYMDVQNGLRLWWESHLWASDCASGGRADLVMAMANLGPVGIWASLGSTVKELALKRAGIILLQDLCISKFSVASLKARLSSDFPQYHSIITTHSASEWEDGKRRKYHYAMVTLLHNHLYTDLNTETVHNDKSKEE
eukprot:416953-Rhodomonas_salina.1